MHINRRDHLGISKEKLRGILEQISLIKSTKAYLLPSIEVFNLKNAVRYLLS